MDNAGFHAPANDEGYYDMFHYAYAIATKNGRAVMQKRYHTSQLPPSHIIKRIPLMNPKYRHVYCGGQPCNLLKIQLIHEWQTIPTRPWSVPGAISEPVSQPTTPHQQPQLMKGVSPHNLSLSTSSSSSSSSNGLSCSQLVLPAATLDNTPTTQSRRRIGARVQAVRVRVADRQMNKK
eukprot:GFYU01020706.1.p1 GENE.GFYU01020706.1~~GFYU01020706.1.p1  ORF type:complete len:190 (+),score=3.12 GFYU01020706.1:37-570(+)